MATKIGTIYALITADKRPLDKALKGARRSAVTGAKKIQTALSKINFKAIALGMAAAGAAAGLAMKKFIDLAIEQEKVEKRLGAVLKATGEAAGYNITQLKGMAAAMQDVTTMGDEAILAGMGILATFKQIRGEAFERTTMAALDLSEVMQQDLRSSMVMLGKALNDPIANLGALGRAGVQFSADQKETIKTLWAMGRTAKAQDIILVELESQFGGTAKAAKDTFGGALKSVGNTLGDIGETIGFALMPPLKEMVDDFSNWIEENDKLIQQDLPDYFKKMGEGLGTIAKYAGLRSILETSYKAAQLIKSGEMDMGELKWDEMGYLERQNLLDRTLEALDQIDRHEMGKLGKGIDLGKLKKAPLEPFGLPVIPKFDTLKLEKLPWELMESNLKTIPVLTDNWARFYDKQTQMASEASIAKAEALGWFEEKNKKELTVIEDAAADTASTMAGSFSNLFVDTVTGEFTTLRDYAQNMFRSILSSFINMATRMAATKLFTSMGLIAEKGAVVGLDKGGIVNQPTMFPFAGGTGLMGEAGPEGILPLARTAGGDLGVKTSGGGDAKTVIYKFDINALDARSFVELAYNTPEAIIGPFTQEIETGNRDLISKLKGI